MKKLFTSLVVFTFLFFTQAKAQFTYCDMPHAFMSASSPKSIDTFTVNVDTLLDYYGFTFIVKLKFAIPKDDILPFAKRPLILGIHGGGFISDLVGGGAATSAYWNTFYSLRYSYALYGFAVASLDYQTGYGVTYELDLASALYHPDDTPYCNKLTPGLLNAFGDATFRATYDARNAIDYIFKNPSKFPFIDTNQIYLYGLSAGAITALHSAFSEKNEFYPASSPAPEFAPKHRLAGIMSFAGTMTDNLMGPDLHHIDSNESVPVFMMHGLIDFIVSPNKASIACCSIVDSSYYWHGSIALAKKLCALRIPYELILADSVDHNVGASAALNPIASYSMLDFIRRRGLCPVTAPSYTRTYSFSAKLLEADTCVPPLIIIDTTTAIASYNFTTTPVSLYPNPAQGDITIRMQLKDAQNVALECYDLTGRVVYKKELGKLNIGVQEINVPSKNFMAGLYLYRLTLGGELVQGKFQIAR